MSRWPWTSSSRSVARGGGLFSGRRRLRRLLLRRERRMHDLAVADDAGVGDDLVFPVHRKLLAVLVDQQLDEVVDVAGIEGGGVRSEEHTSELQSLMRISYAVFCLKKKKRTHIYYT